jgi:ABC-2 type transport system permease protein
VNATYLRAEVLRLYRNKRILIFSMLMPALLLLIFGALYRTSSLNGVSAAAYLMVSMGLFGSMSAAIGSGGTIAVERGIGWNRQLRLTPLSPNAYVLTKVVLSLVMALPPLLVTYALGAATLGVRLPVQTWLLVGIGSWLGALPFAALGLLIGYVAKPDSVQQVSGLLFFLLALFGGVWIPVEQMPNVLRTIAEWTPAYWVGQAARSPLFHQAIDAQAVGIMLAWTVVLALIGLSRFRVDTARA